MRTNDLRNILVRCSLFVILCCISFHLSAQQYLKKKTPYQAIYGVGWNMLSERFAWYNFSNFSETWHILPYPSSLNLDFYFNDAFSLDFMASYNQYKRTTIINDTTANTTIQHFGSLDANLKLSLGFLVPQRIIDPFLFGGINYTFRQAYTDQHMVGLSAGYGITIKFSKYFGIQYRNTLNYSLFPSLFDEQYNYMQHHLGLVFTMYDTRNNRNFNKRKYSWISKRRRFRRRKVGRM